MRKKFLALRTSAALATAVTLVGCVAALAPVAASASSVTKCADKTLQVKSGSHTTPIPVKAITTEGGVDCATAYKVIAGGLSGHPVNGYVYRPGLFKAPEGLLAQMAVDGNKKIKYAVRGA